ncbi:MAG: hypothetical protein Greene041662_569 [Candidatus Peregrinibacteria bacterium Greene0416_62]|nr:MAG: hypothetical protein Greene041662_569 [Candidatus Peregrinibacteria bacterium Greene0416_62]TSC98315.1 MAG: hypothetical protein Greene101449_950 [Candidatus Peregrinibacteria bacterium Greene1014_49]
MINIPTPNIESTPAQTAVGFMCAQVKRGLWNLLNGAKDFLATGVGGVIGAGGTIVGGALDGTSRGIREALGGASRSGTQGALQGA